MTREEQLLAALLPGPQPASAIPMPPRTRRFWAVRLESEGHLIRDGGKYYLTKKGKAYAVMAGLLPPVAPYFSDVSKEIDEEI